MVALLRKYSKLVKTDLNNISGLVQDSLNFISQNSDVDDEFLFKVKVILNELLLNAMQHGNKLSLEKNVEITLKLTKKKQLHIIIKDEGEGYDFSYIVNNCSNATKLHYLCNMKESGRGIVIVNGLCEKMKYNKKGNVIRVILKVNA